MMVLIDWYHVDYVARAEFAADADALQKYEDTRPLLESAPVAAVLAELERLAADGYKELSIGGKISVWRQMRLLTQAELAAKIGTTRQMLGQYELYRNVPSATRLRQIAVALSISVADLI